MDNIMSVSSTSNMMNAPDYNGREYGSDKLCII
jgi:hypothetical protein